jgi:hypothetical protein
VLQPEKTGATGAHGSKPQAIAGAAPAAITAAAATNPEII